MEVHSHSHSGGGTGKKWQHYFWEFFMLFLAVTLGFFVENQREHIADHKRERQYMQSMVDDLYTDSAKLATIYRDHGRVELGLDSLLDHYEEFASGHYSVAFYKYQYALNGYTDFIFTDRTIQQMKNSGGMRLIRKQPVSDSIAAYEADARDFLLEQDGMNRLFEMTSNDLGQIFNYRLLEKEVKASNYYMEKLETDKSLDLLLTHDKQKIEGFYNRVHIYRGSLDARRMEAGTLMRKATRLISFIKAQYHLE